MKRIYQSILLLIVLYTSLVYCTKETAIINQSVPTDQASYNTMIKNLNTKIDLVLNETKPIYLDLNEYKIKLLNGSLKISKNQEKRIMEASKPLIDYGTSLAIKNNIQIDDIESTIALGGLYGPNDNLQTKYSKKSFMLDRGLPVNKSNALGNNIAKFDLTLEEVGVCVITAAGADVLAALAHEGISSWTAAVLSKVFSSVVKKFLGPVGVAIAVVSLTVCLANESIN